MLRSRHLLTLLAAAATAATTACQTTESDAILTRGMFASIGASADGTGSTTVTASLFLGPPSDLIFIDLVAGDQLIAHQGAQSKIMSEQNFLGIVSHSAAFSVDAADTSFEVELRREVDPGAPSSTLSLPAPFTLGGVPASVSRAVAFGVNWTGQGTDRMRWSADGSCVESAAGSIVGDPGSVTLPAGTFRKLSGANTPDSCQVRVTLTREREGQVDPAFGKGGTATASQTRSVTFLSTP